MSKLNMDDLSIVGFDWKDAPETIMEAVNKALEEREAGFRFARVDDQYGDGGEFALLKSGERAPTVQEWHEYSFGEE